MTVAVALDHVSWSEDSGFYLSSCSTAFFVRFMTRSNYGFRGIVMSRRVASVIAAIGVLKTGSATLLNSVLRLRYGIRARSAARALRSSLH